MYPREREVAFLSKDHERARGQGLRSPAAVAVVGGEGDEFDERVDALWNLLGLSRGTP